MSPDYASAVIRTTFDRYPGVSKELIAACALCDAIAATERPPYWPDLDGLLKNPNSVGAEIEKLAADFSTDENWSRARVAVSQAAARRCVEAAWNSGTSIATAYTDRFNAAAKKFRESVAKLDHPEGWGFSGQTWNTVTAEEILDANAGQAWSDARAAQDVIFEVREWLRADAAIPATKNIVGELDDITSLFDVQSPQEIIILESARNELWQGLDSRLSVAAIQLRLGSHRRIIPMQIRRCVEAKELRDKMNGIALADAMRKRGELVG